MTECVRILFVEDVREDAELIWTEIGRSGIMFEKLLVDNRTDYVSAIGEFRPDLIVSDYSLPQFDGYTALEIKNSLVPDIPFILVTGSVNEETAVEIMKAGADDYVIKDKLSRLGEAIRSALSKRETQRVKEAALFALREGEQRFRLAVENSPIPVMIHDEEGKVLMLSKGWTHYSGYSIADIPTVSHWTKAAYGNEPGAEKNFIDRLINISETRENGEWTIRTKSGETRIWEFYCAPLGRVSEGKRVLQSLAVDVTESRRMQEMLIRERDRAEENDKLKTAFLHNISHELRTPMNAIIGFSSLMAVPGQTDEVRASYSEIIMNSCNQLMEVVSDIIEISNIEAGILKYRKETFNIKAQLASIYRQYQVRAEEKGIDFIRMIQLPDSEAQVEADLSKLVTVLTNLLNNAFKFTHEGSVELGCVREGGFLRFRVADTGIGIPVEKHGRIFERFYQVENQASRNYEGAGLGLSISRAYVEFLGGMIWFRSKPGEGSVFEFTLPYEAAAGPAVVRESRISGHHSTPVFSRTLQAGDDDYPGERRLVI